MSARADTQKQAAINIAINTENRLWATDADLIFRSVGESAKATSRSVNLLMIGRNVILFCGAETELSHGVRSIGTF